MFSNELHQLMKCDGYIFLRDVLGAEVGLINIYITNQVRKYSRRLYSNGSGLCPSALQALFTASSTGV